MPACYRAPVVKSLAGSGMQRIPKEAAEILASSAKPLCLIESQRT